MSTNAHFDRIICPRCSKRFNSGSRLRQHMKAKGHDKIGSIENIEKRRQAKALRRYDNAKRGDPNA